MLGEAESGACPGRHSLTHVQRDLNVLHIGAISGQFNGVRDAFLIIILYPFNFKKAIKNIYRYTYKVKIYKDNKYMYTKP